MSIVAMTAVFDAVVRLSGLERRVLLVLANYHNEKTDICWPSQTTIARQAGSSRQSVQKILRRLNERGIAPVVERARQHRAARYRLDLAALSRREPGAGLESSRGAHRAPLKASRRDPRGAQGYTPEEPRGTTRGAHRAPDPLDPSVIQDQDHRALPVHADDNETNTPEKPPADPQFSLYCAIAGCAIDEPPPTDDLGDLAARFKTICAQSRIPCDGEITRKAIEAVIRGRSKRNTRSNKAKLGRNPERHAGRHGGV